MGATLRLAAEDDAAAVAAIINEGSPEPATVAQVRERLRAALQDGRLIIRLVAADGDNQAIGYCHALRDDWMTAGLYWVHTAVSLQARRQGIGSALFNVARDWAIARGATTFYGEARESLPNSRRFAEHHGFRVDRHIFESTLDLGSFDEGPFTSPLNAALASGVGFFTLADVGDTPVNRRSLWEIERTVARDVPGGSESTSRPYETFAQRIFGAPAIVLSYSSSPPMAAPGLAWRLLR